MNYLKKIFSYPNEYLFQSLFSNLNSYGFSPKKSPEGVACSCVNG